MRKTCQRTAFDRITLQIDRYNRNAGGGRPAARVAAGPTGTRTSTLTATSSFNSEQVAPDRRRRREIQASLDPVCETLRCVVRPAKRGFTVTTEAPIHRIGKDQPSEPYSPVVLARRLGRLLINLMKSRRSHPPSTVGLKLAGRRKWSGIDTGDLHPVIQRHAEVSGRCPLLHQ